jgi:hypothetical protein
MVFEFDKVFYENAGARKDGKAKEATTTAKNKGNIWVVIWVVAPFGLHSGLRQNGGRCAAGLDARAKRGC